jgi:hypothetical protein
VNSDRTPESQSLNIGLESDNYLIIAYPCLSARISEKGSKTLERVIGVEMERFKVDEQLPVLGRFLALGLYAEGLSGLYSVSWGLGEFSDVST